MTEDIPGCNDVTYSTNPPKNSNMADIIGNRIIATLKFFDPSTGPPKIGLFQLINPTSTNHHRRPRTIKDGGEAGRVLLPSNRTAWHAHTCHACWHAPVEHVNHQVGPPRGPPGRSYGRGKFAQNTWVFTIIGPNRLLDRLWAYISRPPWGPNTRPILLHRTHLGLSNDVSPGSEPLGGRESSDYNDNRPRNIG